MMPTPLRVLDQEHDEDVVVRVHGVAGPPQAGRLHLARAAMSPRPGVRVVAMADGELGKHDRVPCFLHRVDHRDDDPQRARVGGLLNVAFVRGRYADERNAAGLGDHLDQLLRFTPGERAVLHLDPDEVHAFAGLLRGVEVGTDDGVAEDLLPFLQLRDDGVERLRTGLDGRRPWPCGLRWRRDLRRRLRRDRRGRGNSAADSTIAERHGRRVMERTLSHVVAPRHHCAMFTASTPMPEPHRVTRRQALTSLALAAGGATAAATVRAQSPVASPPAAPRARCLRSCGGARPTCSASRNTKSEPGDWSPFPRGNTTIKAAPTISPCGGIARRFNGCASKAA